MMRMSYFQLSDSSTGLIGHLQAHSGHVGEQNLMCPFALLSVVLDRAA